MLEYVHMRGLFFSAGLVACALLGASFAYHVRPYLPIASVPPLGSPLPEATLYRGTVLRVDQAPRTLLLKAVSRYSLDETELLLVAWDDETRLSPRLQTMEWSGKPLIVAVAAKEGALYAELISVSTNGLVQ
jgi:hypothetical protein